MEIGQRLTVSVSNTKSYLCPNCYRAFDLIIGGDVMISSTRSNDPLHFNKMNFDVRLQMECPHCKIPAVELDPQITQTICTLWQKGYSTDMSCEGHYGDRYAMDSKIEDLVEQYTYVVIPKDTRTSPNVFLQSCPESLSELRSYNGPWIEIIIPDIESLDDIDNEIPRHIVKVLSDLSDSTDGYCFYVMYRSLVIDEDAPRSIRIRVMVGVEPDAIDTLRGILIFPKNESEAYDNEVSEIVWSGYKSAANLKLNMFAHALLDRRIISHENNKESNTSE